MIINLDNNCGLTTMVRPTFHFPQLWASTLAKNYVQQIIVVPLARNSGRQRRFAEIAFFFLSFSTVFLFFLFFLFVNVYVRLSFKK